MILRILILHLLLAPITISQERNPPQYNAVADFLDKINGHLEDLPKAIATAERVSALEKRPLGCNSEELSKIRTLAEDHLNHATQQENCNLKIAELQSRLHDKTNKLDGILKEQAKLISELDKRLRKFEEIQKSKCKDVHDLSKAEIATKVELQEVEKRIKDLQTRHHGHEDILKSKMSELNDRLHGLGKDEAATKGKLQEMENRVKSFQTHHDHREDNLKSKMSEFKDRLHVLSKDEVAMKGKLQEMENRVKNFQTYHDHREAKVTNFSQRLQILESTYLVKKATLACYDWFDTLKEFFRTFHSKKIISVCPKPYVKVGADCLLMGSKSMMWTEARSFCIKEAQKLGGEGDLAVPTDRQAFVKYILHIKADDLYLWIGAYIAEAEDKWQWVTGDTIDENDFPWGKKQPDSNAGQTYMCVAKSDAKYHDFVNVARLQFICQLYY